MYFEPLALFDKDGESLFFTYMRYEPNNHRICANIDRGLDNTGKGTQNDNNGVDCLSIIKSGKMIGRGAYRIEGVDVQTLAGFINQFYQITGKLPEWKANVWRQLAGLKEQSLLKP